VGLSYLGGQLLLLPLLPPPLMPPQLLPVCEATRDEGTFGGWIVIVNLLETRSIRKLSPLHHHSVPLTLRLLTLSN